ncbi:MAG: tRNA dihydrouridine synthase DusB [Deltaproteobacteria bacterium]|nr:tRNA dihydrouridine synthase DusB [Deltaproteobacteria bacterium]
MLPEINIGNLLLRNNIFLAPMAGITDLPFRTLARNFGSSLCFTEMISANGLVRKTHKSYEYLKSSPGDRPLGVQIFGADPDILCDAAGIVTEMGADLVDINAGCPVKKVLKTGAGAALMRDPAKFAAVVRSVRKATHLPFTVKIRSGWTDNEINAVEIAGIAEGCGADALILHPRTVKQGFSGIADWSLIEMVKKRAGIPIIGSGDIRKPEDALAMMEETGCDGVMVARGALGNPWIFKGITDLLSDRTISPSTPSPVEREGVIRRHLEANISLYGEKMGVKSFRKHLLWYTKGLKGGSKFRKAAVSVNEMGELLEMTHEYLMSGNMAPRGQESSFPQALITKR